jgi:hypothetical protein
VQQKCRDERQKRDERRDDGRHEIPSTQGGARTRTRLQLGVGAADDVRRRRARRVRARRVASTGRSSVMHPIADEAPRFLMSEAAYACARAVTDGDETTGDPLHRRDLVGERRRVPGDGSVSGR